MPPLAELQRAFARAVLSGGADSAGLPALVGRIAPQAAFQVHRGTVLAGLTGALRLTYPTVDDLVGADFFDSMALAFIGAAPPAAADLGDYGESFPGFLDQFAPAQALPYLSDVAALDLAIHRARRAPDLAPRRLRIEAQVALDVPASLTVLALTYPADAIRARIEAGDADGLGAIDMGASAYALAVWRGPAGAAVERLFPAAGAFLAALLRGADTDAAFALATRCAEPAAALAQIQAGVFAAPFTTIISNPGIPNPET